MVRLILRLAIILLALQPPADVWAEETREIVFCSYNLENYSDAIAPGASSPFGSKAKPEQAITTLVRIIQEINPDVLGVCEMGSSAKFAEFQQRLKDAGLNYVDAEYVRAYDEDRHLALVSRFPIVARNSQTDVSFELNGAKERVRRGFLDVTVQINPDYQLRCVGVHLKSKLPVPEGESLVRRYEAQKLRSYLDAILAKNTKTNLLCYGDLNDSRNEPTVQAVAGVRGTAGFMDDLLAAIHSATAGRTTGMSPISIPVSTTSLSVQRSRPRSMRQGRLFIVPQIGMQQVITGPSSPPFVQ